MLEQVRTALGRPVVPLLKLKKAQISPFFFPRGILKGFTCPFSPKLFPTSISSFTVLQPAILPSRRNIFSFDIPAFFAATAAISMDPGTVIKILCIGFFQRICHLLNVIRRRGSRDDPSHFRDAMHSDRIPDSIWAEERNCIALFESILLDQGCGEPSRAFLYVMVAKALFCKSIRKSSDLVRWES